MRKQILFFLLFFFRQQALWSASTSALGSVSTSSSPVLTDTIIISSVVGSVAAILGVVTAVTQIRTSNTGFGLNSKGAIDKANKYSLQLDAIQNGLPNEYSKQALINNDYDKLILSLQAIIQKTNNATENNATETVDKENLAKQEKVLLKQIAAKKKAKDKQAQHISQLLRKQQILKAYVASIEKQYGGNLSQLFLDNEAATQVAAAKESLGLSNTDQITEEQAQKIEAAAIANIKAQQKSIKQRFTSFIRIFKPKSTNITKKSAKAKTKSATTEQAQTIVDSQATASITEQAQTTVDAQATATSIEQELTH